MGLELVIWKIRQGREGNFVFHGSLKLLFLCLIERVWQL